MAKSEEIRGSAITKIFEELINYKTLLQLSLLNSDYKQLTRITALVSRNNEPHFILATPDGFTHATANTVPWRIRLEFTGRDRIKYGFTSIGGEIQGKRTFVKMPRVVKRNQRRKLFRINAPGGTKLCLALDGIRPELEVINLSIGGSLAVLVQTNSDIKGSPPFANTYFLKDAKLVFPAEIMSQPIKISSIQIKRMKINSETHRYEVALEFYDIDKDEERKLTDLIYRLQRQYLRKRLPLDI
jgi:c-di-GMP-binding flagellar brake protein YcgR